MARQRPVQAHLAHPHMHVAFGRQGQRQRAVARPPRLHGRCPAGHAIQRQQHQPQTAATPDSGAGEQVLIVTGVDLHRTRGTNGGGMARTPRDLRLQAAAAQPTHLRLVRTEQRHGPRTDIRRTFGGHDDGQCTAIGVLTGVGGREQHMSGCGHGTTMAQAAGRRQRPARRSGHRASIPQDRANIDPCLHWHATWARSIVARSHADARRRHEVERQRGRARSRRAG